MNYFNQFNNPYMPNQPYQGGYPSSNQFNQTPQANHYYVVNGIDGAKSFPVSPNQSILLMDSMQPVAYKKTANGLGQASLELYKLVNIEEKDLKSESKQEVNNVEYASKTDFVNLQKKVDELTKRVIKKDIKEE